MLRNRRALRTWLLVLVTGLLALSAPMLTAAPSQASRVAVPVYSGDKHVGKATTTAFSPLLKKLIALASVGTEYSKPGTKLQMELTIEAQRMKTTATVVSLPFFNPKRKTVVPV